MADGIHKQLGQTRLDTLTATSIYTPKDPRITALVKTIVVCNTTSSSAKFSIYHDDDGTTYNLITALFFEQKVLGNKTVLIEFLGDGLAIHGKTFTDSAGNLAVQTDTKNAFTFTVSGEEII